MTRSLTRTGSTGFRGVLGKSQSGRAPISGHVLKIIRETLHRTQDGLAESLGVEINTIQGWETGRRPLTATSVANFMRLRQRLRHLGAKPELLDALSDAIDADCFLDYVFVTELSAVDPSDHPLATWVMKRSFHAMIAWPLLGHKPSALRGTDGSAHRRGPVPAMPILTAAERTCLFDSLRAVVEKSLLIHGHTFDSEQATLLRRQACFLASLDSSTGMREWLQHMAIKEDEHLPRLDSWSPGWVTARTMAVARARLGEPEPLRWFIDTALASDEGHTADINYWAYWLGQVPESHHGDSFMIDKTLYWHGPSLLKQLVDILPMSDNTVDIYIHSIWALVQQRPSIVQQDLQIARCMYKAITESLHRSGVCPASRRKLENLYYGLQLVQPQLKTLVSREIENDG